MSEQGLKYDNGKPDLALIPYPALVEVAKALMYGEKKYGRHNFRGGFKTHRLISGALRHIYKWESGEDLDPESGVSHLGHALANIVILITNIAENRVIDTRYKKEATNEEEEIQGGFQRISVG